MATGRSTSAREVAHRHDLFVHAYGETGDATAAAIAAGYAPKRADVQGGRLLRDARVGPRARAEREKRIQEQQDDFSRQQAALKFAADGAIATLQDVAARPPSDGTDQKAVRAYYIGAMARVQAAIAILDRAGHKPVERIEADVTDRRANELPDEVLERLAFGGSAGAADPPARTH